MFHLPLLAKTFIYSFCPVLPFTECWKTGIPSGKKGATKSGQSACFSLYFLPSKPLPPRHPPPTPPHPPTALSCPHQIWTFLASQHLCSRWVLATAHLLPAPSTGHHHDPEVWPHASPQPLPVFLLVCFLVWFGFPVLHACSFRWVTVESQQSLSLALRLAPGDLLLQQ